MAKSWDIQPKRKAQPAAAPQPTPTPRPTQRAVEPMVRRSALQKISKDRAPKKKSQPEPIKTTVVQRERVPQGRNREPLKTRRKRARRTFRTIFTILVLVLIGAAIGVLWLPQLRVQEVHASGPNDSGVEQVAQETLQGTYYFVIPRDSILFLPKSQMRHAVLTHYPDIAAISISRNSLQSITLASIPRETSFLWCGVAPDATGASLIDLNATSTNDSSLTPPCYETDGEGYIFAQSSQPSPDLLRVYAATNATTESELGARLNNYAALPAALQFVKAIKGLGVPIVSLAIRSDEADLFTQTGTKITYVVGKENEAYKLASSAFPTLSLNNGSLEYVDLRFTDKVYFKKKGETLTGTTTPVQ